MPKLSLVDATAIRAACERRFAEVEWGYVEGFWGGKQDLKLPEFLAQVIDSLSELAEAYTTLAKKLDNTADLSDITTAFANTDKMVEKTIAFVIENSVLPRIDSLKRTVN